MGQLVNCECNRHNNIKDPERKNIIQRGHSISKDDIKDDKKILNDKYLELKSGNVAVIQSDSMNTDDDDEFHELTEDMFGKNIKKDSPKGSHLSMSDSNLVRLVTDTFRTDDQLQQTEKELREQLKQLKANNSA